MCAIFEGGKKMQICCVSIGGKEFDLARLAQITGRSVNRVIALAAEARPIGPVNIPPEIVAIIDLEVAKKSYREARRRRATFYLLRWLELCQTEKDFQEIQIEIPRGGSDLEVLFLRKATEICG